MINLLHRLLRDERGTALIETAIVAPTLILMSVGGFQVSQVVARQNELNAGADEATAMVQAGWQDSTDQRTALTSAIQASLRLNANQVAIVSKYRCGTSDNYVDDKTTCASGEIVATFLRITLTDQYTPAWTSFGVGSPVNFTVQRTVQVS